MGLDADSATGTDNVILFVVDIILIINFSY